MQSYDDKLAAAKWAWEIIHTGNVVVLDSETTGINQNRRDQPVEIAVVDLSGSVLFESLIKPTIPVDPGAAAVHGIDEDAIMSAPSFAEVYEALREAIANRRVVIYNANFDTAILENAARAHALTPVFFYPECAMLKAAAFFQEWNDYRGGYRWKTLDKALTEMHLTVAAPAHSSAGDCQRTIAVMQQMARFYEVNRED